MRVHSEDLLDDSGAISLSSNTNTKAVYVGHEFLASVHLTVTGSPSGNFTIQASNDLGRPNSAGAASQESVNNWATLSSPAALSVSGAGSFMINIPDCGYNWIRVVWTGSGSASLTVARVMKKGL